MTADPNTIGRFAFVVPFDSAMETTPTTNMVPLLACPQGLGMQMELNYVGFRAQTLPIDATDPITGTVNFVDYSNSATVTALVTAYNFKVANAVAVTMNTIFQGKQVLDPGDVVNLAMTVTTPDTASEGAGILVVGRILSMSGD